MSNLIGDDKRVKTICKEKTLVVKCKSLVACTHGARVELNLVDSTIKMNIIEYQSWWMSQLMEIFNHLINPKP